MLQGIRVVEMGGIGAAPFAAMMLADHGAEVLRIEKPAAPMAEVMHGNPLLRGRATLKLDLKDATNVEQLKDLIARADVLIEGFRPGVMERLGLGPDACMGHNAKLIYARMTGWGQTGPLAHAPGHDINYIALSGALHAIGEKNGLPVIPLNLIGDFAGGMMLAFGISAALLRARDSGKGEVIDAAMLDSAATLMTMIYGLQAQGLWRDERGVNLLDGGAAFYGVYETADQKYLAVGAIEPQFFAALLDKLGLSDDALFSAQMNAALWPQQRQKFEQIFKTKTRAAWEAHFEGSEACVSPVLSMGEAPLHPHNVARQVFKAIDGGHAAQAAPRFANPSDEGQNISSDVRERLHIWGLSDQQIERLIEP